MARIRSIDFLPEIFQTPTNEKFLNSTLDQLIQEPKLKQTQGYIGARTAPGKLETDGYITEITDRRSNYQLEPGVIFKDENGGTVDALTYMGLLDGLDTSGSNVENHDRLFKSETYSWSPFIEFDKFVNYSQYFWLPSGPDSVDVAASSVLLTNDFDITANDETYSIDGFTIENPVITVLRGGAYDFNVNQNGSPFYIQTHPGTDGTVPWADNISSREIIGVTNNGDDNGTITFNVPQSDAQSFYYNLPDIGNVDLATTVRMDSIADQLLSDVVTVSGIQSIDNMTIVFLDDTPGDAVDLGWVNGGVPLTAQEDRYQIFRIFLEDVLGEIYIRLIPIQPITIFEKFTILYGADYSNISFFKDSDGYFDQVPLDTASLDTLYYQDAVNPDRFGIINVVDQESSATLDVDAILGRTDYTSPNGVIFTNGLKVKFRGEVSPAEYSDEEYYVEGVGTSIRLVLTSDLQVPETYAKSFTSPWDISGWDTEGLDGTLNAPLDLDYITINRSSLDKNAWSRSNRWFHLDVIKATAEYNNTVVNVDNNNRATRPIIEFDADLRLFNYGTNGKQLVNIIDFVITDALSTINGSLGYTVDGYKLSEGSRVIFANDADPSIRDKIFVVELIDPTNSGTDTLNLVEAADADSEENDIVIVATGIEQQGKVFTYDGTSWVESQAKTSVNQPPLFDIFDRDGYSLSEFTAYPSTTFTGSKLFSYSEGTGSSDPVLGFPLSYLNIDNLGDIVFENNMYTDTFLYVEDNVSNENSPISEGFARKYNTRTEYTNEIGWVTSIENSRQAQVIEMAYAGEPIELDILPESDLLIPAVRITADGTFITPGEYTVVDNIITFISDIADGAALEIKVISNEISASGYYEVPTNLSSNMFNKNTSLLTLGTIRNHYNNLSQNVLDITGDINGANNLRDLGDISKYGNLIVQQSSPLALAAMFMRNKEYNFFGSVKFASRQYDKFKSQLIDWVEKHDVYDLTVSEILDAAFKDINTGKNFESAFYWSDMLPTGSDYETTEYTVTAISTNTFATLKSYDFLNANTLALLVYHNGTLLIKDTDYTVATDGARIEILIDTDVDDVITINEYNTTLGSNVPSTPTKLGLYPKYKPTIFTDNTYVNPIDVIRGHDGSITTSFGKNSEGGNDIRDLVLLEFEKRVYNNIKVNDIIPIEPSDILPGAFRDTDYEGSEVIDVLSPSLLSWLGWNRIDFKTQDYNKAEEKTWNYSSSTSKIDGAQITQGNWRGIYTYFYDTDAPHERPWEMVGLTERPDWWEQRYGPAPYTSGNLVLWDDMEAGLINEPGNERAIDKYKRPGLTSILPVNSEGILVMPLESVIAGYSAYDFKKTWKIGDIAPAEAAWRKSSAYPFAMQTLYALTKPAQYFALMADRDRYVYDTDFEQYLYDSRHRLDAHNIEILDENLVKHSYINWIIDYNKYFGYESLGKLKTDLSNLDVNLCHHMASFTDKNNLKIFTDKSSPDSTNNSLLLPDESFNLLLYKNQPAEEITYSSIIVQKVDTGYSVIGNSFTDPYFKIQASIDTGRFDTIKVGRTETTSTTVRVPLDFRDEVQYIPYGHIYTSKQAVAEFIASYNQYLVRSGLKFDTYENTQPVDWTQMVQEFVYWSDQGWDVNSIINLNPAASTLEFERELHIVDDLNNLELTEQPLNQNREPLDISDYAVDRIDNNFKIRMLDDNVISYLKFNLTSFEHLLVLDNTSIFNDLIYDPVTGVRQHRVKLFGFTTYEWNGQLDAQGFLYNEDNVTEWVTTGSYNKGNIVKFKNSYWSASEKVQPSETFDFSQWIKTDYNSINKGLLPNIATKADQQLQYYNNKTANLETDIDLFAYGLTGFRSRDYLQSLDLDDISQVNIYSDMIENKGTSKSLNLFKDVELNNEAVDYTIFENWAIKRAQYGATSSRSFIELKLDQDELTSSPGLIEIVDSVADESVADLLIPVSQIFKQSEKNTDKNILPVVVQKNTDTSLPSAGFVDEDDVDIAVFNISEIDVTEDISEGTLIWVANDTPTDWNVYRIVKLDPLVVSATDNLNGTLTLTTNIAHNLVVDDTVVVADFSDVVDGTHKVLGYYDDVNIVIAGELDVNQTCILDKHGSLLQFESARVDVPSDIAGSVFDNIIFSTDKVWVSNDNDKTATYVKTSPFTLTRDEVNPNGTAAEFGYSVSQGYANTGLLVGDPVNDIVHLYKKEGRADYIQSAALTLSNNPNILRYGNDVTLIESWGAVTAPGDASTPGIVAIIKRDRVLDYIVETQILVSPTPVVNDGFGTSVAMSKDENWVYVGEPASNQVHAYQKKDYQAQSATYATDGVSQEYDISNDIIVDAASEVIVMLDDVLVPVGDYTYSSPNIVLNDLPDDGSVVSIARRDAVAYDGDTIEDTFSVADLYALDGIDSVVVAVSGAIQRPVLDYTLTGTDIVFTTPPAAGTTNVVISLATTFRYVDTIDDSIDGITLAGTDRFGAELEVTENSSHIVITAPGTDSDAGNAYILNRVVERFVVTPDNVSGLTVGPTIRTPLGSVNNNGTQLIPSGPTLNPDYEITGNDVTFLNAGTIQTGDFLDVDTTEFKLIQVVAAATPTAGATFGNSVTICKTKCSVYFGAPDDLSGAGSVTRYINGPRITSYITSTVIDPTIPASSSIRINNVEVPISGTSQDVADTINATTLPNVSASAPGGYLTIELNNKEIQSIANRLDILPGENVSLETLGLDPYYIGQTLTSPVEATQDQYFGSSLHIDLNINQLVVGAPGGNVLHDNTATADTTKTTSDSGTTADAATTVVGGGAVYTYDLLTDGSIFTPGKLVFGQQLYDTNITTGDSFGNAVSLVDGILVVGSVDYDTDIGRVVIFGNESNAFSWQATNVQNDTVDVELINSSYIYDSATLGVSRYLDYIDPLNGKILGAANQNIDYTTAYDPTVYNDTNVGLLWGREQVGKIWWNITSIRFLDYNLGDAKHASRVWGKIFPGSSVDVYQWVESTVPPEEYTGTGTVYDTTKFVTIAEIDRSGIIQNSYFFWVNKVETISTNSEKTLSASAIASYIESPASSGISYAAFVAQNTISLYNCKDIIQNAETVLYIEYDKIKNDNNVFVEYDLYRESHPTDVLSDGLYKKFQDSLCGVDTLGNLVPDTGLSTADRYGIDFRPRKSMFIDRYAALASYMKKVNGILAKHTIAEAQSYPLLDSEEPIPTEASGEWDQRIFNEEELSFQDLAIVPEGYTYLLETDTANGGLWAIYEVTAAKTLQLKRVQSYDTKRFWSREHWYAEGFSPFAKVDYVVNELSDLTTLNGVENNAVAKVVSNSTSEWEIHQFIDSEWVRVALENGTMQFDERLWNYELGRYGWDVEVFDAQNSDEEPVIELRQIIRSINEELLVGNLSVERSTATLSVFSYILAEQPHVDWLYKTSLIDVTQKVRSLSQYAVYQKDNQDYLSDYIKESKPYHTKVKDFLLSYNGIDYVNGNVSDFDCPSTYDSDHDQFISPILDDGATLVTDPSNKLATDEIWQTAPWDQWYDNYRLTIDSVLITNPGTGYTSAPTVTVTGTSVVPATLSARVGSGGTIAEIIIDDPGSGYLDTPVITFSGGNGTDVTALAVMDNKLVRSMDVTVKYDRYWDSDEEGRITELGVVTWEADEAYTAGQLVKVINAVYRIVDEDPAATFNPALHELVDIESLSGLDRTTGYYVSDVNKPGLDLSLLIKGIAYPGVEVDGVGFDQNTGIDISPFDTSPFDNFDIGPEGFPTYSDEIIDTIYESSFLDTYLGTRPTDINVGGGAFIDTYHSHAPEELVPGAIFDTLDIKVFGRPGSDYLSDGHAFDIQGQVYKANGPIQSFSFEDLAAHPIKVLVANVTTGTSMYEGIDFTVDWPNQNVLITSGVVAGDDVKLFVYEIGGGNQLHRGVLRGTDIAADTFNVPVRNSEIYESIIFVNGVETAVTTAHIDNQTAAVTLPSAPVNTDFITVTIFGTSVPQREESYPVTQTFVAGTDTPDAGAELEGKNRHNAIVEVNGLRLRPAEVARHTADGVGADFFMPLTGGYLFDNVADNEVDVYVNNELLTQTLDFSVSPPSPSPSLFGTAVFGTDVFTSPSGNTPRFVTLFTTPSDGDIVEVYVRHAADYWWTGDVVDFNVAPTPGDLIAVTTFKDVSELGIFTQVFEGPTLIQEQQQDLFDGLGFDTAAFDLELGVNSSINLFTSDRDIIANAGRLWVTVNGERLHSGTGYEVVNDNQILLTIPVIQPTDVVAVTTITDNVITNGANFRLFKDMRDSVGMYKMSASTSTYLTQDLAETDDIIHVADASVLGQPSLAIAKFGILIVNGERITYRERDLVANTVSGLRRGTAGTGVPELHTATDVVTDVSAKSFVQWDYDTIWYEQGSTTASNGIPLQDQTTSPALFIKK